MKTHILLLTFLSLMSCGEYIPQVDTTANVKSITHVLIPYEFQIKYQNKDMSVDLGENIWGWLIPMDYD